MLERSEKPVSAIPRACAAHARFRGDGLCACVSGSALHGTRAKGETRECFRVYGLTTDACVRPSRRPTAGARGLLRHVVWPVCDDGQGAVHAQRVHGRHGDFLRPGSRVLSPCALVPSLSLARALSSAEPPGHSALGVGCCAVGNLLC